MSTQVEIAVIGAGPYGLSVASHLLAQGREVRVFGLPMQTWHEAMPVGMKLKSEGFASNLSDPTGELTLERYCQLNGLPYSHTGTPVKVEIFSAYGRAFQQKFIPHLEPRMVSSIERVPNGFALRLDDGEGVRARTVVVATGIKAFSYTPPELDGLSNDLVTHASCYGDAEHLAGRDVAVVGGGASATDIAALLRARGANPFIVTRRPSIRFQSALGQRSLLDRIKAPMTGLGPGWKSVLCVHAPLVFHAMPEDFRVDVVRRYLCPAPAWFVRDQVEGHVPVVADAKVAKVEAGGRGVRLQISHSDGVTRTLEADHVISATGYRVDLDRLTFLGDGIRSSLRRSDTAPALSRHFESSVPNLYFVGPAAANSFGPLMRFAYGADYTARRLSRHLAGVSVRKGNRQDERFTALSSERSRP